MLKKLLFTFLIITTAAAFGQKAIAQSDETFPVQKSNLAETNLPSNALKIREASVPVEIKKTLAKLIAAGGDKIRQGGSEVVIWTGGGYRKSNSAQLTKKLQIALQTSGWTYEVGERSEEFVLFSLFRETPSRRVLVGFFVPSDDAYIFALTEMLAANAPVIETENEIKEESSNNGGNGGTFTSGGGGSPSVVGKWWRGAGSGFIDYTGKTQYKSGETYTFEFFPDGTVEYVYDSDVLSIVQCRTKETSKARGKYSVNGDTLTINLDAGNAVGSSSCEAKRNFRKTTPASTITKKFTIKKMESIARPDNPWTLCFDGQEGNSCFEKQSK